MGASYILSTIAPEDVVWRSDIRPLLGDLPQNVIDIWQYGFTEMFNNAIEHSVGHTVLVGVTQTALHTKMIISDDGEGIFKKLQRALGLEDERRAVLELAKGKMTTDPAHHTGEGIFFTSRMFDGFYILSGKVHFTHMREAAPHEEAEDWITEQQESSKGTMVWMSLTIRHPGPSRRYLISSPLRVRYSFNKTVVPVGLAQYGD